MRGTEQAADTPEVDSGDEMHTLRSLWRLQAKSLLALLESEAPLKAAERAAVTAFLRDNGISQDTLKRMDQGAVLRELVALPFFDRSSQ